MGTMTALDYGTLGYLYTDFDYRFKKGTQIQKQIDAWGSLPPDQQISDIEMWF